MCHGPELMSHFFFTAHTLSNSAFSRFFFIPPSVLEGYYTHFSGKLFFCADLLSKIDWMMGFMVQIHPSLMSHVEYLWHVRQIAAVEFNPWLSQLCLETKPRVSTQFSDL